MSYFVNALPKGTVLHGKSYNYVIQKALGQGSFGITYLASAKVDWEHLTHKLMFASKNFS